MIDMISLFNDYSVPHLSEGHKHCQPGWVQIACPYCSGNPGWHLGYSFHDDYFNCWRCGFHSTYKVIKELTRVKDVKGLLRQYSGKPIKVARKKTDKKPKSLILPKGTTPLLPHHKKYLTRRKYNPDKLVELWHLQSSGPTGPYKHRIIAPIYYRNKLVSYQGRDVTDKSELKYKACPQELEVVNHQTILYGLDNVNSDKCVLVEGITDVWRLGYGAVACFGIDYTPAQVQLLYKMFNTVYIFFDNELQAQRKAEKLYNNFKGLGMGCEIIEDSSSDPGTMSQHAADSLMHELSI